jgi:hypothetical protein
MSWHFIEVSHRALPRLEHIDSILIISILINYRPHDGGLRPV